MVDPITPSDKLVNFHPFRGIAPSRYFELFEGGDARKDKDGKTPAWKMSTATPRFRRFIETYTYLEDKVIEEILTPIRENKIPTPIDKLKNIESEFK